MAPRAARTFYLVMLSDTCQQRIQPYFDIQLRDAFTHETVKVFSPEEIVHVLGTFYHFAATTARFLSPELLDRPALPSAPPAAPPRALGVPMREVQEARRSARASRKGRQRR